MALENAGSTRRVKSCKDEFRDVSDPTLGCMVCLTEYFRLEKRICQGSMSDSLRIATENLRSTECSSSNCGVRTVQPVLENFAQVRAKPPRSVIMNHFLDMAKVSSDGKWGRSSLHRFIEICFR